MKTTKNIEENSMRAKKGGEQGMNGEFYHGGQFLPNTMASKGTWKRSNNNNINKVKKEEIEPFKWEVQPSEGMRSIFKLMQGWIIKKDNKFIVNENLNFNCFGLNTGEEIEEHVKNINNLIELFEGGQRWIKK